MNLQHLDSVTLLFLIGRLLLGIKSDSFFISNIVLVMMWKVVSKLCVGKYTSPVLFLELKDECQALNQYDNIDTISRIARNDARREWGRLRDGKIVGKFTNRGLWVRARRSYGNRAASERDANRRRGKRVAARLLLILAWTSEETFLFEKRRRRRVRGVVLRVGGGAVRGGCRGGPASDSGRPSWNFQCY